MHCRLYIALPDFATPCVPLLGRKLTMVDVVVFGLVISIAIAIVLLVLASSVVVVVVVAVFVLRRVVVFCVVTTLVDSSLLIPGELVSAEFKM